MSSSTGAGDAGFGEARSGDTCSEVSGTAEQVIQARDISGGVYINTVSTVSRKPQQLPADVRRFVNRERELELLDDLKGSEGRDEEGGRVVVVVGTAGVGKTALALRWAHRVRRNFPDGQLYINLRGYDPGAPISAADALGQFLQSFGVMPSALPPEEGARAAMFRSLVADRKMLVILDNASSLAQVRPLLPGVGECVAVVTSRSQLSGLVARDGAQRVRVNTLSPDHAVDLLRQVTSRYRAEDAAEDLGELAQLCARLPLALRIAGERASARPLLPLGELVAELRDESELWGALSTEDGDESEAVRTVFAWSYRALSPLASRIFRLLGLYPGQDFGASAVAALADVSMAQARRQLDSLAAVHLLEYSGRDRYEFHDLLRAYARDQLRLEETPQSRRQAKARVVQWYLSMARSVAELGPSTGYLLPADPAELPLAGVGRIDDYEAAIHWFEQEWGNLLAVVRTAAELGLTGAAWQIPAALQDIYPTRGSSRDMLAAGYLALDAVRQDGDRRGEAIVHEGIANTFRYSWDLSAAVEHYTTASEIFRSMADRRGEARTTNGLGLVCLRERDLNRALSSFDRSLAIARQLEASDLVGVSLLNLGRVWLEIGDLEKAEDLLTQSVVTLHDAGERLRSAETFKSLAAIYRLRGDFPRGYDAINESLAIAHEFDSAVFEAHALAELSAIELADGDPHQALVSIQRSALLFRQLGLRDHEASAWRLTGQAYDAIEHHEEASSYHRRAADVHRELHSHWLLCLDLACLVISFKESGQMLKALDNRSEAIKLLGGFSDPQAVACRARLSALDLTIR
jgi:tetratricopeptide (TPR) repeat protein